MKQTKSSLAIKKSIKRAREPSTTRLEKGEGQRVRHFAYFKGKFLFFGSVTAEEIEESRLIWNLIMREKRPKGVSEGMTNDKFGKVRSNFVGEGTIRKCENRFDEKRARGADCTSGTKEVTTEKRERGGFLFEAKVKQRLNESPRRRDGRRGRNAGIISGDEDDVIGYSEFGVENSNVVISVVIVSSRFASKAHACEGTELRGDRSFKLDMEVDEERRNTNTTHF